MQFAIFTDSLLIHSLWTVGRVFRGLNQFWFIFENNIYRRYHEIPPFSSMDFIFGPFFISKVAWFFIEMPYFQWFEIFSKLCPQNQMGNWGISRFSIIKRGISRKKNHVIDGKTENEWQSFPTDAFWGISGYHPYEL